MLVNVIQYQHCEARCMMMVRAQGGGRCQRKKFLSKYFRYSQQCWLMSSSTSTVRLGVWWWWGRREGADIRERNSFQNILNIHRQCWSMSSSTSTSSVYGGGGSAGRRQGNCFPNWKNTARRETESGLATLSCFCTNLEKQESGFNLALGLFCESH